MIWPDVRKPSGRRLIALLGQMATRRHLATALSRKGKAYDCGMTSISSGGSYQNSGAAPQ